MTEIEAKLLKLALRGITQVVERRNTIPILGNVLLVASTRELRLTATDLDIQIERRVGGTGKTAFTTTTDATVLSALVAKLPAEAMVKLSLKEGKLVVASGRSVFKLATLPPEDLPIMTTGDDTSQFGIAAPVLATLFDTTRFAVSSDETRYYLNGVFLHVVGEQLKAAATDGHRLASVGVALPDGAEGMSDAIVPRKTVDVMRGLLDGSPDVVDVTLGRTKVRFQIGDDVLVSKLIDGTFPDYTRVIPTGNEKRLAVAPAALAQAVERVTTIASDKTRVVSLALAKDVIRLGVVSIENGLASEDVPADYAADEFTVGFNGRYLLDVLRQFPGKAMEVMLDGGGSPTLFRRDADADALFVLMPTRV